MLDGMPDCYRDFIYEIESDVDAAASIAKALRGAVEDNPQRKNDKHRDFLRYAQSRLTAQNIANMMMELCS
jgi:hypothetical protein